MVAGAVERSLLLMLLMLLLLLLARLHLAHRLAQ